MKIFFSILIIATSLFGYSDKRATFLKFMYKPSKITINDVLIDNLESNEKINSKLIEYYLNENNLKLALYYSKKFKNLKSEFRLIIISKLFLKLKKEENAIKLLNIALFDYNSESAFYILQNLKYKKHLNIKNFYKIIKKGVEINPYLINFYYPFLLNNKKINKKELFELYLSYNDNFSISKLQFKSINLTTREKLFYLEKIIKKNNYSWAKKLYKKIIYKKPYFFNLRRLKYVLKK